MKHLNDPGRSRSVMPWLLRKAARPFENLASSVKKRARRLYHIFKAKCTLPLKRAMAGKRRMEIEVITMMYNEAIMASLFVRHYAPWVDTITVFYSESADGTREALETTAAECGFKALRILPFEFSNGFDDVEKKNRINQAVLESKADFAVCVDADEFVYPWPFTDANPRRLLENETASIIRCRMFQVYRHATDANIDLKSPPLFQRRHGAPDKFQEYYDKPCIVRPDAGVQFQPGCHKVTTPYPVGRTLWRGAHWGKADHFCLRRYLQDRGARLSEVNKRFDYGLQHLNTTGDQLLAELKSHENDPQLF